MLTLLRKIRRSLLESSSIGQYLVYAIGEVLLVAIGILLALQVNNWNEEKKRLSLEREMLQSIKTSLESDLVTVIEPAIDRLISDTNQVNSLLAFFEGYKKGDEPIASYSSGVVILTQEFGFEPQTTAYKTLESHGLGLIQDKDILENIVEVYDRSYPRMRRSSVNKNYNIREYGRPIARSKFKTLPKRGDGWEILDHDLYDDPIFWNYLHTAKINDRDNLNSLHDLKMKIENLIDDLSEKGV